MSAAHFLTSLSEQEKGASNFFYETINSIVALKIIFLSNWLNKALLNRRMSSVLESAHANMSKVYTTKVCEIFDIKIIVSD